MMAITRLTKISTIKPGLFAILRKNGSLVLLVFSCFILLENFDLY